MSDEDERPKSHIEFEDKEIVHPSLDFKNDTAYCSFWLRFSDGQKKCVIMTDTGMYYVIEEEGEMPFEISHYPNMIDPRWRPSDIQTFLKEEKKNITIQQLFINIKSEYEKYIEFSDQRYYTLLSLWTIGTYFFPIFKAYPYIFLNAIKRAGKTKVLTLNSCLAFNARFSLSMTPSTLFRFVQNDRCTLLIDEIEKLTKPKELGEFRSMLLAGYKKGGKVPRTSEKAAGHIKKYVVEEYEVYSPKMMANIEGIEDVLEDRCITIIMERALNEKILNKEIDIDSPVWWDIRDCCYRGMYQNWRLVLENYKKWLEIKDSEYCVVNASIDSKDINIEEEKPPTLTTQTTINPLLLSIATLTTPNYTKNDLTTPNLDNLFLLLKKIKSRDLEISLPIISLASLVGVNELSEIISFFYEFSLSKQEENVIENSEYVIIEKLLENVKQNNYFKLSEILAYVKPEFEDAEWCNSRWLGRRLKRLNLVSQKRRLGHGIEVMIDTETLKRTARRLNIEIKEQQLTEEQAEKPKGIQQNPFLSNSEKILNLFDEVVDSHGNCFVEDFKAALEDAGFSDSGKVVEDLLRRGVLFEVRSGVLKKI